MALILNEEQTQLRDSARVFLAGSAPLAQLRQLRDSADLRGYSQPLWQAFSEMGYTGILVPEAQGGLGLGHVEAGVVMEAIGRNLTAAPFLASCVVAATAIRHAGSPAQQQELLPGIASGSRVATLAVDEHGKHRPQDIALAAVRQGSAYRLNGSKTFVLDGHVADLFVVAACTGGVSLFAVDAHAAGVEIERVAMVDARPVARIRFNDVAVGEQALLGTPDGGGVALDLALDVGRAAVAAELLGIAEEVLARTVNYLKERRQFDKLIGEFQALQHRTAVLYCDIELARSAVLHALQCLDAATANVANAANAERAAQAVAVAKSRAGRSATLAVQEGVQMHGGMGMTEAFDMGFFMRRARVLQELFGDANWQADRLARLRNY